jgi:hypothetical protein
MGGRLEWLEAGNEMWGYSDLQDPFTAYAVRPSRDGHEAWDHTGEHPELIGTYPGMEAAKAACQARACGWPA